MNLASRSTRRTTGRTPCSRSRSFVPTPCSWTSRCPIWMGTETLRLISEIDEQILVVVVSGYASEQLAKDLLQKGACDFFQKPVDLVQLVETVKRLQTLHELNKP